MSFEITGTMTVSVLRVPLDDGRIVNLYQDGTVQVQAGEHDSNAYTLELPTVATIARACDDAGRHCGEVPVMVPAHHRG